MPLPILNIAAEPTQRDLIRFFHRTGLHWAEQISEPTVLDVGVAHCNPALALVQDANHLWDTMLPEGMAPEQAVAQVEAHFQSQKAQCHYWVVNPSAPVRQTEPLVNYLLSSGFSARSANIFYLKQLMVNPPNQAPGLKIIPARASFRHSRDLAAQNAARWGTAAAQLTDSAILRLDDPHYDALIALKDGEAVASGGVLAVGDMGRIENVFVVEKYRGLGIGRTMLARLLEICARSLFKHIFLEVDPANATAIHLYTKFGFAAIGQITAYVKN